MEGDAGGWLWLVIDVVLVMILAIGLIYGTMMWRRRSRDRAVEKIRDETTTDLYQRDE